MRKFLKVSLVAAIAALGVMGSARQAAADIIVAVGVSNDGTDNVTLTNATNVPLVVGTVGGFNVNFTSVGGNLSAPSSGQARVEGAHSPFDDLSFFLDPGYVFTKAVFNVNSANDGSMTIQVTGINIDGGLFQGSFGLDDNGQNFYNITAINLQYIERISLIANGALVFEDLRQIRLGGMQETPSEFPQVVPEPASMMLFGSGLAAGAAALRRRRRQQNA